MLSVGGLGCPRVVVFLCCRVSALLSSRSAGDEFPRCVVVLLELSPHFNTGETRESRVGQVVLCLLLVPSALSQVPHIQPSGQSRAPAFVHRGSPSTRSAAVTAWPASTGGWRRGRSWARGEPCCVELQCSPTRIQGKDRRRVLYCEEGEQQLDAAVIPNCRRAPTAMCCSLASACRAGD